MLLVRSVPVEQCKLPTKGESMKEMRLPSRGGLSLERKTKKVLENWPTPGAAVGLGGDHTE